MGRKATDLNSRVGNKVAGLPGDSSIPHGCISLGNLFKDATTHGGDVLLMPVLTLIKIYKRFSSFPKYLSNFRKWHTAHGSRLTVSKNHRLFLWLCILILPCALSLVPYAAVAATATITIGWDPPPETVAGYKIHYGIASGDYDVNVDVGNYDSCTISGLAEGQTYYFAATSYKADNTESSLSTELVHTIPSSGSKIPASGDNETKIWIEAEDGVLYSPMEENWDDRASSGGYIWTPKGYGNLYNISNENGSAEYTFEVQQAGTYLLWGRVISNNLAEDSFFISVDGEAFVDWHTQIGDPESWIWDQLRDGPVSDGRILYLDLEAGQHILTVKQREDGTKLDKILLTSDIEYVPEGEGGSQGEPIKEPDDPGNITNPADFKLWLEAERGNLGYPFESASDSSASAGQYAWVPNGYGNNRNPSNDAGCAVFEFEVPTTEDYVIWGCVLAKSRKDNSFYVSVDEGPYIQWDTKRSTSWLWDQVRRRSGADPVIYHLEAGSHTLNIKQREDGTKIDKILITNDAKYVP